MLKALTHALATLAVAALPVMAVGAAATAETDAWQPLLDPAAAERAIAAEDNAGHVTVIDIRSPREYLTGHLPGAVNAPYPAWRGPARNPGQALSDAELTALLRAIGLTAESRALVTHAGIDQTDFGAAARVYWTLKSAGLSDIAILNGGVRGWVAEGRTLSVDIPEITASEASFTLSEKWMASRAEVAEIASGTREGALIDARPRDFYVGKAKHSAAKAPGTIAGASNLSHDTWFTDDPTRMPTIDRVKALADAAGPADDAGEIVSFCNTGHWAATTWFALSELAGKDAKLYPESVVGWSAADGVLVKGE